MNHDSAFPDTVTLRINKQKIARWLLLFALLCLSSLALMINPGAFNAEKHGALGFSKLLTLLRNELRSVSVAHALAFPVLGYLYHRLLLRKDMPFSLSAFLVSGILSVFMMLGMSFSVFDDFTFLIGSKCQVVIATLVWLGCWIILYAGLKLLYTRLDHLKLKTYRYEGVLRKLDQHFALFSMLALMVCWLLFALPYFPGSVPHDGRNQLNMVFGYFPWHTHHPYYSTLIMGAVYGLGEKLFGIIGGCVFFVLFQSLLGAWVFSRICEYIRFKTRRLWAGLLCLAYFAFVPVWWTYMQTIAKDTLHFIAYAFFTLEYVKIFLKDGKKRDYIGLILSAVAVCCLRNGYHFIVLPALLVLVLVTVDRRKLLCLVFCIVFALNFLLNTVVINALQLTPVNQVEALSIPLQQIAYYVKLHDDEMSQEEKDIINAVVQYEGIPERYNPELSDPIKNRYRNTTEEEWSAFWELWLDKLFDDPWAYITATMNHVYGYIDAFYFTNVMNGYQLYNKEYINAQDKGVVYSEYVMPEEMRDYAWAGVRMWQTTPVLSFAVNPGAYTWLGIILIGALLRKRRWRSALTFVAPLMCLLVCFASPVNGLLRYVLPILAASPLLVLIGLLPYLEQPKESLPPSETAE